jgi:hypothetical protein
MPRKKTPAGGKNELSRAWKYFLVAATILLAVYFSYPWLGG